MREPGWSLKGHLIVAFMIYFVDGIYVGQGVIAVLLGGGAALAAALAAPRRWSDEQPRSRRGLSPALVYAATVVATLLTIALNNKIARGRAEQVISAVKQYKAKYQTYPRTLEELVPEFLSFIPRVSYRVCFDRFHYSRLSVEGAFLMYVKFPPFGRPTYKFFEGKWAYLD